MLVDRVSLGNPFTTISFHLYVLLKVSWGTQSIYWNVMILNKVLSEIIFITRLFLLKVLSTPQSKLFVCLFKCLYIRTLSTVLCTRRLSIRSWMHEMVLNQMFLHILYIFTIGVSNTGNNGEKTTNLTNLEITRSYHTVFSGVF